MTASALQILLVEDDAGVRRFFEMICTDLPVALRSVATARDALAALDEQWPDLLITDLMLPGEHGLWLIEQIHARSAPADHAPLRICVFSADASPQTAQAIAHAGVWRTLRKPASITEIEDCIEAARHARDAAPSAAADPLPRASVVASPGDAAVAVVAPVLDSAVDAIADPVAEHFGGNQALFTAFASSARARFASDVAEGEAALQRGDAAQIERLAHSLKTVLRMLGDVAGSQHAAQLEALAHDLVGSGTASAAVVQQALAAHWPPVAAALAAQHRLAT
jgi:CheY-like chemotaxis protein